MITSQCRKFDVFPLMPCFQAQREVAFNVVAMVNVRRELVIMGGSDMVHSKLATGFIDVAAKVYDRMEGPL